MKPLYLEVAGLAAGGEEGKREVSGLALPYGEDLDRPDWNTGATVQRFAEGSAIFRDNSLLYFGHDHLDRGMPIGKLTSTKDTPAGPKVSARISATAKGEEVYTLAKDGVLDRFSIGFYPVKSELDESDPNRPVLTHTEIDVFEVSIVPEPAYQSAVIDHVLSSTHPTAPKEGATMPEAATLDREGLATSEDITALSQAVDNLERRISTLSIGDPQAPHVMQAPGDSYGEFLQMVTRGEPAALEFLAYVGGTTVDLGDVMKDSWVGERFRFVEAQRTVLNFFAKSPLPASGMGVEYGVEGTDTTAVGKQAAEGDTLAYGKITFDTDRAALETFGGWGEMTFQEIQRSPVNVVEKFFDALLRRYAQTTEARVSTALVSAGTALTGGVLDMATTDGWTRFIIRSARALKATGYPLEGILVGFDVFESVALMKEANANDRFLDRDTGTVNATGLSGEVFNVPMIPVETGSTTGVIRAANSQAIRTYEAGGAPFRLQDEDITNLSKAGSIYGYMATALEVPKAIVKPAVS